MGLMLPHLASPTAAVLSTYVTTALKVCVRLRLFRCLTTSSDAACATPPHVATVFIPLCPSTPGHLLRSLLLGVRHA